jgi:hypothetical protein
MKYLRIQVNEVDILKLNISNNKKKSIFFVLSVILSVEFDDGSEEIRIG